MLAGKVGRQEAGGAGGTGGLRAGCGSRREGGWKRVRDGGIGDYLYSVVGIFITVNFMMKFEPARII